MARDNTASNVTRIFSSNDRAELIERFVSKWRTELRPPIAEYLSEAPQAERVGILTELVQREIELRIAAGELARVEEYLSRYPELCADSETILMLLRTEHLQRTQIGPVDPAEYQSRFPQIDANFAQQLPTTAEAPTPTLPGPTLVADSAAARWPTVAGYTILGELGRGGMGVVYLALQDSLQRRVALKMIRDAVLAGADQRSRLLGEAAIVAGLQHPNIVQVYEVGEAQGQPFFSMELITGGTLASRLNRHQMPAGEAASLVEDLAHGLQAAHDRGIVHRDLKPANVLLTASGLPKVVDFGLARQGEGGQTVSGAVFGTPNYMAPEQAAGHTRQIDARVDVYGLGTILYECLTGGPPFRGESHAEVLRQVQSDDPVPIRRLQPRVPRDLETICAKCLAKDKLRRYATAAELADDLNRLRRQEPIHARPVGRLERLVKFARRRPASALLLAFALLLVVGGFAAAIGVAAYLRDALERRTDELRTEQRRSEAKARGEDYRARVQLAAQLFQQGDDRRARDRLAELRPKPGEDDLRDFEWHYLWDQVRHDRQLPVSIPVTDVHCLRYSPDGKRIATGHQSGAIKIWDAEHGNLLQDLTRRSPIYFLAWSPDGRRLAAHNVDFDVTVWNLSAPSQPVWSKECLMSPFLGIQFVQGGQSLALVGGDFVVELRDAGDGALKQTLRTPAAILDPRAVAIQDQSIATISPSGILVHQIGALDQPPVLLRGSRDTIAIAASGDGRTLVAAGSSGDAWIWDPRSGRRIRPLVSSMGRVTALESDVTGSVVVSRDRDHRLYACETATGLRHALYAPAPSETAEFPFLLSQDPKAGMLYTQARTTEVVGFALAPDANTAAIALTTRIALVRTRATPPCRSLDRNCAAAGPVAVSPRGDFVALADDDRSVHILKATDASIVRTLPPGNNDRVTSLAFSPDGADVATGSADGTVSIWDSLRSERSRDWLAHPEGVLHVCYTRDGAEMVTCGADNRLARWNARTGQFLAEQRIDAGEILAVATTPDGSRMAVATASGRLTIWNCSNWTNLQTWQTQQMSLSLALSADGRWVASAEHDQIPIRNVATGEVVRTCKDFTTSIFSLQFAPDAAMLFGRARGGGYFVWDTATGRRQRWGGFGNSDGGSIAVTPDGRTLVLTSDNGRYGLIERNPWKLRVSAGSRPGTLRGLGFSADGRELTTIGRQIFEYTANAFLGGSRFESMLSGSASNGSQVWQTATGRLLSTLPVPGDVEIESTSFSADGRRLLAGGSAGVFWEWDLPNRSLQPTRGISTDVLTYWNQMQRGILGNIPLRPDYRERIIALAASSDGLLHATLSDRQGVQIWHAKDGSLIGALPPRAEGQVRTILTFVRNGTILAVAEGPVIRLFDVATRQPQAELRAHIGAIFCLSAMDKSNWLVSGSADRSLVIWNLETLQPLARCEGHAGPVLCAALSPNGRRVATGSDDRNIKIWSVPDGLELLNLARHDGPVQVLAFSADGKILASGGQSTRTWSDVFLWSASGD